MKKNVMLKIASVLMVAVLLTTCAISSTFAKYVTSDNDTVTAKVAKWGVKFETDIQSAFASSYDLDTAATFVSAPAESDGKAVYAGSAVVAPGTTGTIKINATVTGAPEVAVRASLTADLELGNWYSDTDVEYCPLVFTVNGATYSLKTFGATNVYDTVDDLEAAVEGAFAAQTKDYAVGQSIAGAFGVDASWSWAYEGDGIIDASDSKLGDAAAENNGPTISLTITQTITQID